MVNFYIVIGFVGWCYLLSVLNRAHLPALYYWCASIGMFILLAFSLHAYFVWFLASLVSRGAGLIGILTHTFSFYAFPAELVLSVPHGVVHLMIDYECSGIIETTAFLSLLTFFPIYTRQDKIKLAIIGFLWIYLANVARLVLVGVTVHFLGPACLFWVHGVLGRLIFYILTIILYYNVFTHSQIVNHFLQSDRLTEGGA